MGSKGENVIRLACPRFSQGFELPRAFLCAKKMGEKRGKFQDRANASHSNIFFPLKLHSDKYLQETDFHT